jgi:hypothetical protein
LDGVGWATCRSGGLGRHQGGVGWCGAGLQQGGFGRVAAFCGRRVAARRCRVGCELGVAVPWRRVHTTPPHAAVPTSTAGHEHRRPGVSSARSSRKGAAPIAHERRRAAAGDPPPGVRRALRIERPLDGCLRRAVAGGAAGRPGGARLWPPPASPFPGMYAARPWRLQPRARPTCSAKRRVRRCARRGPPCHNPFGAGHLKRSWHGWMGAGSAGCIPPRATPRCCNKQLNP